MSGEKRTYVSVEERELRRLREQESRLRAVRNDLPERLDAVRRQAQEEMRQRLKPMEERQRRQKQAIDGLQSGMAGLERDTRRRIEAQQREFTSRLEGQRGEYLRLFREQDARFTGMIDEERKAREQAVRRLQGQIDGILADAARKQDMARAFVADLSTLVTDTDALPHQRFAPGRLDGLRRHVEDAGQSLAAGMPESALSTAQRAYWELADLRAEVQVREREFTLIHQAALEEARVVLEEARANRRCDLELGREPDCETLALEVDYWTHGGLSAHEAEVEALHARLLAEAETIDTDQVREMLKQLETLRRCTPEIVEQARRNILSSHLRFNIAELAAESFQAEGFTVQDAAYEGEDQRKGYVMKMANIAGDEVVTVITPVEGEMGRNEVSVNSFEAVYVDENVRYERARAMIDRLREQGLEAGTPAHAGEARTEYRDMTAVRSRTEPQPAANRPAAAPDRMRS